MQRSVVLACLLIGVCLVAASVAFADSPSGVAQPSTREVNITSDSAPGWLPSAALEAEARKFALDYLAAKDSGRTADAYALLTDGEKQQDPFAAFSARLAAFSAQAGAIRTRQLVKFTWTKDPAQAPAPGIYVAIDLVSQFANVDRHCGYLVLYRKSEASGFGVAREEENFIDNGTAKAMTPSELDKSWSELSARCPNFPNSTQPAVLAPLPEQPGSSIGYPSVDAAIADLHSRPDVVFSSPQGWTVAADKANETFWSFPPPGHPAYPSAVKRQLVSQGGGVTIQMTVLCGGSKTACDDLVREFQEMNARAVQGPQNKQ